MSKHLLTTRHTLIMRDADGKKLNGTSSCQDIDGTRRLARNILLLMPEVATVDIYNYDPTISYDQCQPITTVSLDDESEDE